MVQSVAASWALRLSRFEKRPRKAIDASWRGGWSTGRTTGRAEEATTSGVEGVSSIARRFARLLLPIPYLILFVARLHAFSQLQPPIPVIPRSIILHIILHFLSSSQTRAYQRVALANK